MTATMSRASIVPLENPEHDFPQRIVYERRPGGGLTMRIEGTIGGDFVSSEWAMERADR